MRRHVCLLLLALALPCPAQQPPTTQPNAAKKEAAGIGIDPESILLLGMPVTQGKAATLDYIAKIGEKTALIEDPVLRGNVRLTLAAIQAEPDKAATIRQRHLANIAGYFIEVGKRHLDEGDLPTALQAAQLAFKCNPTNPRVKLFYADLLHRRLGQTDEAISLLKNGIRQSGPFDVADRSVLERYGQLLQARHADTTVVEVFSKVLQINDLDAETRSVAAGQLATSLYWAGRYPEAVAIIEQYRIDRSANGILLHALALFDGGRIQQAFSLLENRVADFKGPERDAILGQHARLLMLAKQPRQALSILNDRISLDPNNGFLRVQRLAALAKLGQAEDFDRELQAILQRHADNDAVMLALANFASQRGASAICETLANLAIAKGYDTATFSALHLESLIRAGRPDLAVRTHQNISRAQPTHFRSNQAMVQALLGIAHHLRPKANPAATTADRSIADKHLDAFLAELPGPEAYRSVARHLMDGGAAEPAARVLAQGVRLNPWHSQLRADWISARILAGQSEARGTRASLADEAERLLAGRRPIPTVWGDLLAWLRSEAGNLEPERRRRLEAAVAPLVRPDLDKDAFLGR
jgi:lipopolysaccharide biosynthesis regulator YciM